MYSFLLGITMNKIFQKDTEGVSSSKNGKTQTENLLFLIVSRLSMSL